MAKLPIIDINQDVGSVSGQQKAGADDFVPGWRQVEGAIRAVGGVDSDIYQAGETEALARQREALSNGEIGEAIQRIADPLEKRFKQADMSRQQVEASRLHMQWAKHAMERIKSGDAYDPNLTDGFLEEFDQSTADMVNGAQTDEGKLYLTHALAEMRSQFGTQVMAGQSERASQQIRTDNLEKVANRSETARMNFAMVPLLLRDNKTDAMNTAMMLGGDRAQASALTYEGNKAIAVAGIEGQVQINPALVKAQLALQPADRDPTYKAMAPYLDGKTTDILADHADQRIKALKVEKEQQEAKAKADRVEANGVRAGEISNAIDARQATLKDGTRVIDAIVKMKTTPGALSLGAHLASELKASTLDGARIVGDATAEVRVLQSLDSVKPPTLPELRLMVGRTDANGKPNGISREWYSFMEGEIRRRNEPAQQMNNAIKRSYLESTEKMFKDQAKKFAAFDTAGLTMRSYTKFLVDFGMEFDKRTEDSEHPIEFLNEAKPNNLATMYRKYFPTLKQMREAAAYLKAHPTVQASELAEMTGKEDPPSYGNLAVSSPDSKPRQLRPGLRAVGQLASDAASGTVSAAKGAGDFLLSPLKSIKKQLGGAVEGILYGEEDDTVKGPLDK